MLSVSKYILLPLLLVQSQWSLADPVISEFLASNDSELADADGDFSDWIEIYNPDPIAVNMAGWHLTDDDTNLTRWTFPSVTIPAGGYLVVFASNKGPNPIGQELHTDFKLSSDGEYLALVKPNGITTTSEFNPFPAQNTDISYGLNASVSLLAANAPLHYTLSAPALDGMGKAWTAHDFDDSSWISMSSANSNYSSQDVPKTARKPNWSNSAGTATSTTTIASQNSPVSSVKLRFNISRTAGSSLTVSLRSPQGTSVNVFSNGSNANNFSIDLTQFNNETLNGEWTLTLTESGGNWWSSNQSTLNSWSLEIPNGNSLTRSGIGYDTGSTYNSLINTQVPTGTAEMWLRFPFQVADSSTLSSMLLKMRYDDGFEAFINGTPVASANITSPIAGIESDGYVDFDLTAFTSSLQDGDNILAIRVVNSNTSSSDLLCLPELTATGEASATAYALLPNPTPGLPNQGGALNPGPVISEVAHSPNQPTDGDNLLVTANVQPRQNGIASVNLIYRVNYASEVSIAMLDDGTGADAIASDGVYSASIPAAAANPGQMLRWKIQAQDNTNLTSTLPLILDTSGNSQSPEYYGTLIAQPSVEQGIPVMHWFTQSESNSRNRTGARASVYYEGVFYDNIYVRQRGGFTNNGSQKFDFNKGHPFNAGPQLSSVGEVNMNGNGNDSSYVRQPLGFQFHQAAGNPGCTSFPVHMRLNGSFDRIGTLIEQVDEDFLKRYGYDHKDGELYKLVQRSNLNPVFHDTSTGVEKK
ncbi:MAG: lamin tail domain-containing protein, partial [Akkermansiaceae bacterium]